MKKTFTRKGYGRIYIDKKINISRVKRIIKEIDEFEFTYLPENFITTYDKYPELIYIGKFDELDINFLTITCWNHDIFIFCLDNGHEEFVS